MKARVEHANIITALSAVKPAVTAGRPFVRLVVDEAGLTVTADDLNVGISATVPAMTPMGDDDVEGRAHVPYRMLHDFVRAVGNDVEIVRDGDDVIVAERATRITLRSADDTVVPQRPLPADEAIDVVVDGAKWATVQKLAPFCSTDPALGARTGVNFFEDKAIGTDGFLMALVHESFGFRTVVPAGVIAAVGTDAEEVALTVDDRSMRLHADGVTVVTSSIEGHLGDVESNWRPFFEAEPTATLRMGLSAWDQAVAVARIPARDGIGGGRIVILRFGDDGVTLEPALDERPMGTAVTELDCVAEGVDFDQIIVNEASLSRAHALVGGDEVCWEMTGNRKPIIIRNGDTEVLAMPIFADR